MLTNTPNELNFNLISIIKIAIKWWKKILLFAILVALITAIYAFMQKNTYKSFGNFYANNGLISSRDNLFRTEFQDAIDQFGLENETDHLYSVANCAPVLSHLIEKYNMAAHYKIDIVNDPKGKEKVYKKFAKNYKVNKGAYGNLEITVTDENSDTASAIANEALIEMQDQFGSYYRNSAQGVMQALQTQMKMQDSVIASLTDTLVKMREQFGIYDIISPSRKGNANTSSHNARGIETIQNIEEIKDKYVVDRARYESIKNEFATANNKCFPYLQVIQYPTPSGQKAGPFRTLMVIGAFAFALFLGVLCVVLIEFYTDIKNKVLASA
jgi:uncharacterized protein involved in exopolysaccharide biosynthesis